MTRAVSPYTILGLPPGADRTAIDEAYYRLIKLHHPDRSGGDAKRAAEINHAYTKLKRIEARSRGDAATAAAARARREVEQASAFRRWAGPIVSWLVVPPGPRSPDMVTPAAAPPASPREFPSAGGSGKWRLALYGLVTLGIAITIGVWASPFDRTDKHSGVERLGEFLVPRSRSSPTSPAQPLIERLDGDPDAALVAHGVALATAVVARGEIETSQKRSERCFDRLKSTLDPGLFDRCAAFDQAMEEFTRRVARPDGQLEASVSRNSAAKAVRSLSSEAVVERRLALIEKDVRALLSDRARTTR